MFVIDLLLGWVRNALATPVPPDEHGPIVEAAVRAAVTHEMSSTKLYEQLFEGSNQQNDSALSQLVTQVADDFEHLNAAVLRLVRVRPEHRLRRLHRSAVVMARGQLVTGDLKAQILFPKVEGVGVKLLPKYQLYRQAASQAAATFFAELKNLQTDHAALYRSLGLSNAFSTGEWLGRFQR